ncbi:MAG TPA: hypothetical protein VI895_12025 [Bdellovibrionota bacterium]|nr:hypothetical protein [Bdellovibrionota bacterium]
MFKTALPLALILGVATCQPVPAARGPAVDRCDVEYERCVARCEGRAGTGDESLSGPFNEASGACRNSCQIRIETCYSTRNKQK